MPIREIKAIYINESFDFRVLELQYNTEEICNLIHLSRQYLGHG